MATRAEPQPPLAEPGPPDILGSELPSGPVSSRARLRVNRWLLGLPAMLLIGLLVLVPVAVTFVSAVVWSVQANAMTGRNNFWDLAGDPDVQHAVINSVLWLLVAGVVLVIGFGLARLSLIASSLGRVLILVLVLPAGVSSLAAGAAFRLIFDPTPERSLATVVAGLLPWQPPAWLGPGWVWLVLISAFAWIWLGFAVTLFRAGLEAMPAQLLASLRRPRRSGRRRLSPLRVLDALSRHRKLLLLLPVSTVVVLTVLIAALRVFDLILIVAPGSVQDDVGVMGVQWWRSLGSTFGERAVLAVLLFAFVNLIVFGGQRLLRGGDRDEPAALWSPLEPDDGSDHRGWRARLLAASVIVLWVLPMVVLFATALHDPVPAVADSWWSPSGVGFTSFGDAVHPELLSSLTRTFVMAVLATGLVVVVGVPAAYLLLWGGLSTRASTRIRLLLTVLVATPVQMYAGPLGSFLGWAGVTGSPVVLAIVHAAAGLPFAILVLYASYSHAARHLSPEQAVELALGRPSSHVTVGRVWQRTKYSLIAVAVLEFVWVWNDFIVGLLISGPGSTPLTLVLWGEARQFVSSSGAVAASAVIALLPPVILLALTWSRVVRGLIGGGRQ
ncbi:sugar ABC transporter permease [Flindersiella endophytica]